MSLNVRWREWCSEYERRKAIDKLPARFALLTVAGAAYCGRFLAGVSGIGMALSISAMFSSYISLSTVDVEHICVASQFVSDALREGHAAAMQFFVAGVLALVAAAVPGTVWLTRNAKLHDLLKGDTQPLPFKRWASGLSEMQVNILFFVFQLIPLLLSANLVLRGFDHALGQRLRLSPAAIQSIWQGFQSACHG